MTDLPAHTQVRGRVLVAANGQYTWAEVAEILGVAVSTVRAWGRHPKVARYRWWTPFPRADFHNRRSRGLTGAGVDAIRALRYWD